MISFSMNPLQESLTVRVDKVCPWSLIPSLDNKSLGAVTPPRKYYTLTKEGKDHLKELHLSWIEVDKAVKKIINTKK